MADTWTWDDHRAGYDMLSDLVDEWQGFPIPVDGSPLVLNPTHPLRELYESFSQSEPVEFRCSDEAVREDERIVNTWHSRERNCQVFVIDRGGRRSVEVAPQSPDRSMDRLTFWMQTIGASDAWDLDAEHKAQEMLSEMVTERQWRHYQLTGSFFETSPRSKLTYVFRRLRPTLALSPRGRDGRETNILCIAVLCLHPIGYYSNSWAGCMVPTDDLVAHLTYMRGDEAGYWAEATQHAASAPEAGI